MITGRTVGTYTCRRSHIRVETNEARRSTPLVTVGAVALCLMIVIVFSFLNSAYEETRDRYMEILKKEKQAVETNKALKMEIMAMGQKGYVEFFAQGKLGLKKPTDQEVVVLR